MTKPVGGSKAECPCCGGSGWIEFDYCGHPEYRNCNLCNPPKK